MLLFIMVKLFHASPVPLSTDILEPRTSMKVNGKEGAYLFAASDKQHALTYTITKGIRLMNAHVDETGRQILVIDAEKKIGDPVLNGEIYNFESDNFEQAVFGGKLSNQWVSTQNLNLEQTDKRQITSLNDIMKEGVQIFQIGDSPNFTAATLHNACFDSQTDIYDLLQEQLSLGNVKWMNQERSINPNNPFPTNKVAQNSQFGVNITPSP